MLSVLITIYNYNVLPIVKELQQQCLECNIEYEILTQDDASNSIFNIENEKINLFPNCSFISLEKNLGLRENKNLLAAKSKYEYLLIIDGDCLIINPNFIKAYIVSIQDYDVIYGGRVHPTICPSDQQTLRWKYGKYMEDKSVIQRLKKPYESLLFNNALIKKSCFNSIKFDTILKGYGHDDTLFSYQLKLIQAKVKHLENPIEHNDIDTNPIYLNKTKGSLENLIKLYKEEKIDIKFIQLLKLYHFLKRTKSTFIISKAYLFFEKSLTKNLTGSNPNLLVFNLFRIGYLSTLNSKQ
jgi:glycosyltransferase involved in cell wall biosynthesis